MTSKAWLLPVTALSARRRLTKPYTVSARIKRATAGKLFRMPKPTIAALPGAAAGAGLALALACDMRIMAQNAIMTTAFARVGFSGDYGGSYFLTQLVGAAKARELYFLSDRVGAEEALRLGLTNWVCATEDLAFRTLERLPNGWRTVRLWPTAT